MRSITLDIETTGLSFLEGHKIVEIGCVELLNNFPSGKTCDHKATSPNRKKEKGKKLRKNLIKLI